ncbi:MAG: DUF5989 family protein [bacterium]
MAKFQIMKEFWQFIKEEKVWWITPIVVVFLLLLVMVFLVDSGPAVLPFIYTIF